MEKQKVNIYKLTKVSKLGQPHPDYGQSYWADAEGVDLPLKFNSHKDIGLGTIVAESSENKKSIKGTDYLQLRGVKLTEQVPIPAELDTPTPPSDTSKMLQFIYDQVVENGRKLDALMGDGDTHTDDEPIDLDNLDG